MVMVENYHYLQWVEQAITRDRLYVQRSFTKAQMNTEKKNPERVGWQKNQTPKNENFLIRYL